MIDRANLAIPNGLGRFPISEDPEAFQGHLLPVLEKVRGILDE